MTARFRVWRWPRSSLTLTVAVAIVAAVVLLSGYFRTLLPPPASAVDVPPGMRAWVRGAGEMIWTHIRRGPPPLLLVIQLELCDAYAIVFFPDPDGVGLLWGAGLRHMDPARADGGESAATRDPGHDDGSAQHGRYRTVDSE